MSKIVSQKTVLPAGGGTFELPTLSVGIFLNDQPSHRFSLGASRTTAKPLVRHQGWMLPAGSNGVCEYDDDLDFVMVSLDQALLEEFGIDRSFEFDAIVGDIDPLILNLSLTASTALGGGRLYRETLQRALTAQIVETLSPTPQWRVGIEDVRLRRVLDYIHDNLANDLSIETMAGIAAMSGTHFSKAFKKETGRTPLQYVISERLDMAATLLKTGTLTVAEIASRVGYGDLSRFGQHFKRKFGVSPAAYRKD
ncbi:AraC family transcriptional regulator [Shimia sp. SDUM112013]|uniref:AraC family transcriptional regulator n=1 Tax=Shimia sp. SDUM112013 TaxID=3136160 RepID=UPI0032EED712